MRNSKAAGLVCLLSLAGVASATERSAPLIDRAFERLYNFDFAAAQKALDQHIAANPKDPLGPAMKGSAYLFYELDRLMVLESEFFADDKKIADKKKLKPDPEIRKKLFANIDRARAIAEKQLASKPEDTNALFAMCISYGVETDYTALVEKRQMASLSGVKKSTEYAHLLLKVDPGFYDAYLSTGLTEYLIGSLPFFVRWFVRVDDIDGSKEKGIRNVELTARRGNYLKPFAKVLLAIVHIREKQPTKSLALLEELAAEFPENPLYRKERDKVAEGLRTGKLRDRG